MLPHWCNSNAAVYMDGPHICSNKAVRRSLWLYKNTDSVCVRMGDVVHHRIKFAALGMKSCRRGLSITPNVTVHSAEVLQKKSYTVRIFMNGINYSFAVSS